MTEDEAKTKWCPAVRVVGETSRTWPMTNREERVGDQEEGNVSRCLGSACMAWRWWEPWTSQAEEGVGGDIVIRLKRKPGEPKLGYCGLAGRPE